METRANYVLIGAFTLLASLALLFFGLWAANWSTERHWQPYTVAFNEAVTGLSVGSPVQYNGISIGSITALTLDPVDPRTVVATLRISATAPIKTDTRAKLAITSLTGPTIIQLSGGSPNAPRLTEVSSDPVPQIATAPSALQNITDTASRLVERMDVLLSESNIDHLSATLASLDRLSGDLADRDTGTPALLSSLRQASRQLESTLSTANSTLNHLDSHVVQRLPAVLERLDASLTRLDGAATQAEGILSDNRPALNSFATEGLGQLGPTLNELRGLIRDLRQVSDRLESNPAGYLLGREAPKEFEP